LKCFDTGIIVYLHFLNWPSGKFFTSTFVRQSQNNLFFNSQD